MPWRRLRRRPRSERAAALRRRRECELDLPNEVTSGLVTSAIYDILKWGLLVILGPIILAYWTKVQQHLSLPLAISLAIVVAAASAYLVKTFWPPSDAVRIKTWLVGAAFGVDDRNTPKEGYDFYFIVRGSDSVTMNIFRKRGTRELIMSNKLAISPQRRAAFMKLPIATQRDLEDKIMMELLKYGVQWSDLNLATSEAITIFDRMVLTKETDEDQFLRRLFYVRNGAKLLRVLLNPTATE